jgi:hypothetical protein
MHESDLRAHLPVRLPIVRPHLSRGHPSPATLTCFPNQHNLGWGDTEYQPGNLRPLLVRRILELL